MPDETARTVPATVSVEAPQRRLGPFASFEFPAFRYLWLNSIGFALVQSTQRFAFVWLVLELGGGPKQTGLVTFVLGIPSLLLVLPAGILADRADRRLLMLASQVGVIAVSAVLTMLIWTDRITMTLTMALAVVVGAALALGTPVRQAVVPSVVPKDRLMNAIVLNSFVMNVSLVVGPAIAGAVIDLWGVGGSFAMSTAAYLFGIVFLLPLRLPRAQPEGAEPGRVADGFRFIAQRREIMAIFVLLSVFGLLLMGPYTALLPAFARDTLGATAFRASLLFTILGAGTMISTLTLAALGTLRRRGAWFLAAVAASGALIAAVGLSRSYWLTAGLMLIWGCAGGVFMNLNQTLVQSSTPMELMGRVMSVHSLCFMGMAPIGGLVAGAAADSLGAGAWIVVCGAGLLLAAMVTAVTQPGVRRMT